MEAVGSLLQLAAPRLDSDTFESLADLVTSYAQTPVFRQHYEIGNANGVAFRRIGQEFKDQWSVMMVKAIFTMSPNNLTFTVDTRIKPSTGNQVVNDRTNVVGISVVDYAPTLMASSETPAIAQFTVNRTYAANGSSGTPVAGRFRFGELHSQDLITLVQCQSKCADEARTGNIGRVYPTIRGYFNSEQMSNYSVLNDAMKVVADAFDEYNHMNVLLRTVGIDFSNPAYPRVTPELSSFSIVMGSDANAILLSKENNVEFRGRGLYNGILASKVAYGLSSKVRKILTESNRASAMAMGRQANSLGELFNGGVIVPAPPVIAARPQDGEAWHCIDKGISTDESFVYAHPCHGEENQRFVMMPDRTLTLIGSGFCLDVDYTSPQRLGGYRLYLHPCHGEVNQRWPVGSDGTIKSDWRRDDGTEMCIDIHTGNLNPNNHFAGYQLYVFPCHAATNQRFRFESNVGALGH